MPIPASINDLSTTAGSNSPPGSESPTDGDGYLRAHGSFIAILRDKLNGTSDTGTVKSATFSGTMAGAAAWSGLQTFAAGVSVSTGGNVLSGTYTPTATGTDNVASATGLASKYIRVGSTVHVAGSVTIDPTSASALTAIRLSLPIASDFTAATDCAGVATRASSAAACGATISAGTVNNDAVMSYLNDSDVSSLAFTFTFTYEIK